jgi:hypothetical protein
MQARVLSIDVSEDWLGDSASTVKLSPEAEHDS